MASFLSLPAEIRTDIYELYIQIASVDCVTFHLDVPTWSSIAQDKAFLPSLCRTSRTIRAEFLPLWASHLTITIDRDAVQYRSDQQYILSFLDAFGPSLVRHCKDFNLPFCKIMLEGKRDADEEAFESARGDTFLVLTKPHEDANVRLLKTLLMRSLREMMSSADGLSAEDLKQLIYGPLRTIGQSYVRWDHGRKFDNVWIGGACLKSRTRGL